MTVIVRDKNYKNTIHISFVSCW